MEFFEPAWDAHDEREYRMQIEAEQNQEREGVQDWFPEIKIAHDGYCEKRNISLMERLEFAYRHGE